MNAKNLKNDPYGKYVNDRSRELIKKLAYCYQNNQNGLFVKWIANLCYSVSVDEAQILENQAVLNDPSSYKNGSRDELLKMFGKQFIDSELSRSNYTYRGFDKRRYMNAKGGDNE